MSAREIIICKDQEEIFQKAAEMFVGLANEAIERSGRFSVALSGGSTPRGMYLLLASDAFCNQVDWSKVHIFWGDERSVAADHKDSNYRMALESMLSKLPLPTENIYRMPAEEADIEAAALAYEKKIREFFSLADGQWAAFDLVLLGMGDDGHTASLFPGTKALSETRRIVVANWVEKLSTNRMTLTYPAINHAKNVLFMAAGAAKTAPLKEVLKGEKNPNLYPSQLINPENGKLYWMIDEAAAGDEKY